MWNPEPIDWTAPRPDPDAEGYDAAHLGDSPHTNPYPIWSKGHERWNRGFIRRTIEQGYQAELYVLQVRRIGSVMKPLHQEP